MNCGEGVLSTDTLTETDWQWSRAHEMGDRKREHGKGHLHHTDRAAAQGHESGTLWFHYQPFFPWTRRNSLYIEHVAGKYVWKLNALVSTVTITFCKRVQTRSFVCCSWREGWSWSAHTSTISKCKPRYLWLSHSTVTLLFERQKALLRCVSCLMLVICVAHWSTIIPWWFCFHIFLSLCCLGLVVGAESLVLPSQPHHRCSVVWW